MKRFSDIWTMPTLSLRTIILGFIVLGFAILLLSVYWVRNSFIFGQRHEALKHIGAELLASGNVQIEEIIPGLLLKEEKGALTYVLNRLKEKENLSDVSFVTDPKEDFEKNCHKVSDRSFECTDLKNNKVRTVHRAAIDGQTLGFLIKEQSGGTRSDSGIEHSFIIVFILLATVLVALVACITFVLQRYVRKPILSLEDILKPALSGDSEVGVVAPSPISEIRSVFEEVQDLISRYQDSKTQGALGQFAAQVAHDIIAPITTLRLTVDGVDGITERDRKKINEGIERVRNIAVTLRDRQKRILSVPEGEAQEMPVERVSVPDLSKLVRRSVEEKKRLYKSKTGITYRVMNSTLGRGGVRLNQVELQRILSNILDNAVEAIPKTGRVSVSIRRNEEFLILKVSDTGKGIPKEIIPKLGNRGMTFGKCNGVGLGLFHAKSTIEHWGGVLKIQSNPGVKTSITITIPMEDEPIHIFSQVISDAQVARGIVH